MAQSEPDAPRKRRRPRLPLASKRQMARMWLEEELSYRQVGIRFGVPGNTAKRIVERFLTPEVHARALADRERPVDVSEADSSTTLPSSPTPLPGGERGV